MDNWPYGEICQAAVVSGGKDLCGTVVIVEIERNIKWREFLFIYLSVVK